MSSIDRTKKSFSAFRLPLIVFKGRQSSRSKVLITDGFAGGLRLDGLTAVLALVKEAEVIQDQYQHQDCAQKAGEYIARLAYRGLFPETLIGELSNYLARRVAAAGYFFESQDECAMTY